ncbi:MAG: hypothetical protein A2V78_01030 [Betaproteobacteria bacterium RBG_16_64_18]|nr:MAG: hypothetical protein A2V78_01030 [Betaproteobacteria bacterium RBG_16_64_18]OGA09552.1 MAG: hypothetical protein A3H33_14780 [Betaproteobacteria bacterium RIFCSPLOWO2_02_FULL_65_20]
MNRLWVGLGSVLVLIAIGAYFWLRPAPQQLPPPTAAVSPPVVAPVEPAVKHPVQAPPGATGLPPYEQADDFVKERITELLGAKTVKNYIRIDNFVRRVAATVDNLSRSLAPPRMWPVRPTPGRFTVEVADNGKVIGAKNAARYAPFVALVESVDSARAVALYQLLYPLFQRAYEHLGYPGKHFNDRLVAVIDLLLETPEPPGPLKVDLPEIEGPLKPTRPWVLYRFSDPDLEGLSSGQKILLRVGRESEKRLKAKLAEIRKLIAAEKVSR